jgi:hypothetical protein
MNLMDRINNSYDCAILASGATVCLTRYNTTGAAYIDVNGKQGPNILGRDLYTALIDADGTVHGDDSVVGTLASADARVSTDYGFYLQKIQQDGWKMDY